MAKLTKIQKYEKALAIPEIQQDKELVELFQHEIESLGKRKGGTSKKAIAEREANQEALLDALEVGKTYSVSDIIKTVPTFLGMNPQKVSPICKSLESAGLLTKSVDKRKTVYQLATTGGQV